MNIQVFGQDELEERIKNGNKVYSHLISIGNPGIKPQPDILIPKIFKSAFTSILRFRFYDATKKEQLGPKQRIKRIPNKKDVKKLIKYYQKTKNKATGYTIHCWRGISRSTAMAYILLYLIYKDEKIASDELISIRRNAMPNRLIISIFDELYDTNLSEFNKTIFKSRIERMRQELSNTVEELESP